LLEESGDGWLSLAIPFDSNGGDASSIAPGAVAGLIENCGSLAANTAEGVDRSMLGATLSMSIAFGEPLDGGLVGSGRLIARSGSTLSSAIEIWSPAQGCVRADGLVCYRIAGAAA
jgi:acyl-coenzyme A thioesterase PaaI-like protein